jgi:hypothetical protein
MGINIVAVIPNRKHKTQEEINEEFGVFESFDEVMPNWKIFEWEGESYASWIFSPRYINPEIGEPKWEAVRKYLHRAMLFLGADVVFYGNDVVTSKIPDDAWDDMEFLMPPSLDEELIKPPDYEKFPELKEVEELRGITW